MKKIKLSVGIKASVIYTISSFLSKGLAIITIPIFTRLMSTEEIGVVNLYVSWFAMISTVSTLSLTSGGFLLGLKEYGNEREKYTSSILTLTSLVSFLLIVSNLLFPSFWKSILNLPKDLIWLLFIGLFFYPATEFWLSRQRYEYKYKLAGSFTIATAIFATVLSTISVIYASELGIENLADVRLKTNYFIIYGSAFCLWCVIMLKGKCYINFEYWKFSLALSLPLMGHTIASQVLSVSDRIMISNMVGNDKVGIYSTLYTVSSLSLILWSAINSSFVPFLFEHFEKVEQKARIAKVASMIMIAYCLMAIGMTMAAPEIVKILATEEYYESIYIMPPIAAGVFLTSISNMYSNILVYYKKTQFIMIASILAALINVILNFIMIPHFGYMAAAYTTLVAYIVLATIQMYVARRIHKQITGQLSVYNDHFMVLLSVGTIICCIACLSLYSNIVIRYGIISGVVVVCFIFKNKIFELITVLKKR